MSQFNITEPALTDLDDIWYYIARDSEEAADRVLDKIYDTILSLYAMPGMGRIRRELAADVLSFPVSSYVIYYRRIEEGIEVMRVLHGARDTTGLFAP